MQLDSPGGGIVVVVVSTMAATATATATARGRDIVRKIWRSYYCPPSCTHTHTEGSSRMEPNNKSSMCGDMEILESRYKKLGERFQSFIAGGCMRSIELARVLCHLSLQIWEICPFHLKLRLMKTVFRNRGRTVEDVNSRWLGSVRKITPAACSFLDEIAVCALAPFFPLFLYSTLYGKLKEAADDRCPDH